MILDIQYDKTNAFAIAKEERDELPKRRQRKDRNIGLKRRLHRENVKILQYKRREQVARKFRKLQEEKIQQQQIQIMQLQNAIFCRTIIGTTTIHCGIAEVIRTAA